MLGALWYSDLRRFSRAGPRDSTGLRTRSEGARIGLIARGQDGLEGARRDVESLGGQALILQADVADADAVEAAPNGLKASWAL
jgi:NADP-dependent 3-hydroxy acid dehydrogenase YdfG